MSINQPKAYLSTILIIGALSLCLFQCVTTVKKNSKKISIEQQKAIQDSLKQEYLFEMRKFMSFGTQNYKNKLYHDVPHHLWKVVELDTINEFPTVYQYLGDAYIKLDQLDSAEMVYRLAIQNYSDNPYYHRSLAWLLSVLNENNEAIEEYRMAIETDSTKHVLDFRHLANLLLQENRIDEAIEVYQQLVEIAPDDAEGHTILAQLLKSTGDEDAAILALKNALQKDPNNTTLMFDLGEICYKRGDFSQAIETFNLLLSVTPKDVYILELLGDSQKYLEQFAQAISTYKKVLILKPDNHRISCAMSSCYKELNEFEKARKIVEAVISEDENYGYAHIVHGEIYEAAADECRRNRSGSKICYDDKLVYKMAYKEYKKAKQDNQFSDDAQQRMTYIMPDIPAKQDSFMHPNQVKPELDCYQWIFADKD